MELTLKRLHFALQTLTVFRNIRQTAVISTLDRLLKETTSGDLIDAVASYAEVYSSLMADGAESLGDYISNLLKFEATAYAEAVSHGTADSAFDGAADRDVAILSELATLAPAQLKGFLAEHSGSADARVIASLPQWATGTVIAPDALRAFYRDNGTGIFAKHRAFLLSDGALQPVPAPDPIDYGAMVGYTWQRQTVLENTQALLAGSRAQNVLLYGDSGTGKSATVKSMLNEAAFKQLRLIEVKKQQLYRLPALLGDLERRALKFILFIDDLTFEEGDADYSIMKTILEGSVEQRPLNVVIYATSNRRQLVKRSFSDQTDMSETETVQEKTSLSDRFGLRLPYFSLNQPEYLSMVEALAGQLGVRAHGDQLRKAALQWAMTQGSRTPRSARQLAEYLAAGAPLPGSSN